MLNRENQGNSTINRSILIFLADLKNEMSTNLLNEEVIGLNLTEG